MIFLTKRRVPEEEKKVKISISVPKWIANKLRKEKNYSKIIVNLLETYFQKLS
jgi:hypothetical protein